MGLHLCSSRPRKWNSGQGLFKPDKFLKLKNGEALLINFVTKMDTIDGDRLIEEVSDQFAEMIRETISIIKESIK